MIILHLDLDNTLIYSYRHEIGREKTCVEIYRGRELSFMTERSMKLLRQAEERAMFVPVTTRTEEQYQRICLGNASADRALVCNGGVLLENGAEDTGWYQESLRLVEDCREELEKAEKYLEQDSDRVLEVRNIRDLFLFTKSSAPEQSSKRLEEVLDLSCVEILSNGTKLYVLPRILSKGTAVERFRKRMSPEYVMAAGDSEFDLPMLEAADTGFAPETLAKRCRRREKIISFDKKYIFSDVMLENVCARLSVGWTDV